MLEPLSALAASLGIKPCGIGHDGADTFEPTTYASEYVFGSALNAVVQSAFPGCTHRDISSSFAEARAVLCGSELESVRQACAIASRAFCESAPRIRPGMTECEIAAAFQSHIQSSCSDEVRSAGFVYCMSGPNAAKADAAFQLSRARRIQAGDLVLVHCNSHYGGYWTDLTRTYCMGEPTQYQRALYQTVLDATEAALEAVKPGAEARHVETARHAALWRRRVSVRNSNTPRFSISSLRPTSMAAEYAIARWSRSPCPESSYSPHFTPASMTS